jgi:nitrate/nitrite transporter NarK
LLSAATHHYVVAPASVLPRVSADLAVTGGTAIWLVSAVPGTWALTNFALGVSIDRQGDYRAIAAGTAGVVACGVWSWWAARSGDFSLLLASRLVAGVAVGVIWTASTNLIGGAVSAANRSTAIGVFLTSAPAGFALGQLTTPTLASVFGWPATLLVMSGGAIVAFVTITFSIAGLSVDATSNTASMRANMGTVLSSPAVRYGCIIAFAVYSYYLFMNSWLPSYLAAEFGTTPALSGILAAVFPAMGILARPAGGAVSDRLLDRRRLPVLQGAFLVSLPVVVAVALTRELAVVLGSLVVAGFVIQLTFGVVYSYVRESVRADVTGTALSFLTTAGIFGAFSSPLVTGVLIDASGGYVAAFGYATVITALGLGLSVLAPESRSSR